MEAIVKINPHSPKVGIVSKVLSADQTAFPLITDATRQQ